jgi:hypothetical protein
MGTWTCSIYTGKKERKNCSRGRFAWNLGTWTSENELGNPAWKVSHAVVVFIIWRKSLNPNLMLARHHKLESATTDTTIRIWTTTLPGSVTPAFALPHLHRYSIRWPPPPHRYHKPTCRVIGLHNKKFFFTNYVAPYRDWSLHRSSSGVHPEPLCRYGLLTWHDLHFVYEEFILYTKNFASSCGEHSTKLHPPSISEKYLELFCDIPRVWVNLVVK